MSYTENNATEQRDVYLKVMDAIINAIEAGVSNWHMPWCTSGKFAFSPINVASRKLSISEIASGLKCTTELVVDGDARYRERGTAPR